MRLQRYYDVSQSNDVESFKDRLVAFAHDMGFGLVMASLVVEGEGRDGETTFTSVGNTPDGFAEASGNLENSLRDPVLKRMRRMSVPFLYDRAMYEEEGAGDLWEEQAPFGYRTGICVAMHLPKQRHFLLGVDRDEKLPEQDDSLMRMMADLQLLAVHAQSAGERLLQPATVGCTVPEIKLTPREREVLCWTMEGKSSWAVGAILGMSEHTVNFHIRKILKKLDTASKHHAVLKALSLGLI